MLRIVKWAVGVAAVQGLLLFLIDRLLPGFDVSGIPASLLAGCIVYAGTALLWPVVYWLSDRFHVLLFPVLSFVLTGVMLLFLVDVVGLVFPGSVRIDGVWTGMLVALSLTAGNTLFGALFGLDDDGTYDRFVTGPLRRAANDVSSSTPGVIFLEIDGLAEPILRRAMDEGYMPTLKRWVDSGSHRLQRWEPDLSAQTSASQAGILLGSNWGIPAFRWWDKSRNTLMVSSQRSTARTLEHQLSTGDGLLADGGASRWNVFSGNAVDNLGTYSRIGDRDSAGRRSYLAYFSNPYCLARTVTLFVIDVVREWIEAGRQRILNIRPRIRRGFTYAFVRAGTTVLLQEASRFMLTADMFRGVPTVYNTFFAYDEVAHHSGIDRLDSFKVLRSLDRVVAHLERVAEDAPRPYHLVILSDHGQSQGATFRQRFGITLAELVDELMNAPGTVTELGSGDEGLSGISSALTEVIKYDTRTMRLLRRAARRRMVSGQMRLRQDDDVFGEDDQTGLQASDAIVVGSGNLGLISFPHIPERMTYEQIRNAYPGLLSGLTDHPGISFVMVHSEDEGGLIIGRQGIRYLSDGHVAGEDPLQVFGANAAAHLDRTDRFSNAPDILVMSMYEPDTGEVAAFEELVGSHGGLGGPQTEPFVLFPSTLEVAADVPIVGAAELHRVLKSWVPRGPEATGAESVAS